MRFTKIFEDIVIARWSPGDEFSIDDAYSVARELKLERPDSTIRRTLQELRDRSITGVIPMTPNVLISITVYFLCHTLMPYLMRG